MLAPLAADDKRESRRTGDARSECKDRRRIEIAGWWKAGFTHVFTRWIVLRATCGAANKALDNTTFDTDNEPYYRNMSRIDESSVSAERSTLSGFHAHSFNS